jgi:5-methylcytosine-specific restriction endonuclease McrA
MRMTLKLKNIKSFTMARSWKLGLIKPSKPKGIELIPLKKGTKFNHLTIIKLHHIVWKYQRSNYYYLCQCDCGKRKIIVKESIRNGETKSCGCYRRKLCGKSHRKEKFMSSARAIYRLLKIRAKNKLQPFKLSFIDFVHIARKNCFYCGKRPSQVMQSHKNHYYGTFYYNGIDRINSQKGYIKTNVITCCKYCNYAKNDLTTTRFFNHIKKIYEHIKNK